MMQLVVYIDVEDEKAAADCYKQISDELPVAVFRIHKDLDLTA